MAISFSIRKRKWALQEPTASVDSRSAGDAGMRPVFSSVEEVDEHETEQRTNPPKKALLLEDVAAKVRRLHAEGNTLAGAERYRAAMDRWRQAIALDGKNGVMYELLAQAAMAVGDDFDAVQYGLKAVENAPVWGDAYHTLARCHINFGELELALKNIEEAIQLNGENAELLADKAEIQNLLNEQTLILERREHESARETDEQKLQVISCMKHLSLRGRVGTTNR